MLLGDQLANEVVIEPKHVHSKVNTILISVGASAYCLGNVNWIAFHKCVLVQIFVLESSGNIFILQSSIDKYPTNECQVKSISKPEKQLKIFLKNHSCQ